MKDDYDRGDSDLTATEAISAPRRVLLLRRHADEISTDMSEMCWLMMGNGFHLLCKLAEGAESLVEERLFIQVLGWKISGQVDLMEKGVITDYKVTSVYSFLLGDKPEWEQQLNIYSLLAADLGIEHDKLQIVALLRDWMQSKVDEPGYPECGILAQDIEKWPLELQQEFLKTRVAIHQYAANLPDDELPACTPEERWARPDKWAVMKKGGKKATKVYDAPEPAMEHIANGAGLECVHRPGKNTRCEDYCKAVTFCNQFAKLKAIEKQGNQIIQEGR
jgi:hypothetical protein